MCDHHAVLSDQPATGVQTASNARRSPLRFARLAAAAVLGVMAWSPLTGGGVAAAAPATTCIDLSAYDQGSAPAGSGDLGTEGVDEDLSDDLAHVHPGDHLLKRLQRRINKMNILPTVNFIDLDFYNMFAAADQLFTG